MRALLILVVLALPVGAAAVGQSFWERLLGSSTPSDVPEQDPMMGSCDPATGYGPDSPLCAECRRLKKKSCDARPGPLSGLDCEANFDELPKKTNELIKAVVDLQKKLEMERKKDDEFIIPKLKAGQCAAVVDYLQPRIKELERLSIKGYVDALDSALVCLSSRHAKAKDDAKEFKNPVHVEILSKKIADLGELLNDLREKMSTFSFQVKVEDALSVYRDHIRFCNKLR